MFNHLDGLLAASPDGSLSSSAINAFEFEGRVVRLIVQAGIWKPAGLQAALTIRTTYTPPNQLPPYADDVEGGVVHYKYRGTDPNHADNRALIRQEIKSGRLRARRIGSCLRITRVEFDRWLTGMLKQRSRPTRPSTTRLRAGSRRGNWPNPRGDHARADEGFLIGLGY